MTITTFKKITLFATTQRKPDLLVELQSMGCIHLISINQKKTESLTSSVTTLLDEMRKAIKYLKDSPEQAKQKIIDETFDADKIVKSTLTNQQALRDVTDKFDFLQERIKDLSVWGNFVLPNKGEMGDILLWFYKIKHKDIPLIPKDLCIQEVHRDNMFVYLVVLSSKEPPISAFATPRIHTGAVSLNELRQELQEVIQKIDDLNEERRQLTRYRYLLSRELAHFTDRTTLQQASQKTRDHKDFFLTQGWIPESKLALAQAFCKKHDLGMTIESVSRDELPPTLLQTYPWSSAGVELVNFYQLPSYHALDPSFMVFFSFSLFFAMILADAGYGLVIALFTLLCWKWLGKFNAGTWLRPLLVTISLFSIIYGVLLGSYFGVEPSEHSILHKVKFLDINHFNSMMMVAIIVGCIHIIVANALRSWFADSLHVRMQSIGIIILIIGFMSLAFGLINHADTVKMVSIIMIALGMLCLIAFASDKPVTNFKSFALRLLEGLLSLAEITALFSDILSYLRLFALGLAGASLAITFNHIATNLYASSSYGWIFAFLVLLIGQTLNFVLCVMSGVIHGLRLNYIEFFKWSFKEEGYPYQPFKKMEVLHE